MNVQLKTALTNQLNSMRNAAGAALRAAEEVPAGRRPAAN
jgi:hypothetical protein